MDDELEERVRRVAEEDALVNAIKHESDAQVDAIVGSMMADNPAFREHGDAVARVTAEVVAAVNDLDPAARRDRLDALAPDRLAALEVEDSTDDEHVLPELPNAAETDQVRMRLAPNPNGPWHLGNARMPAVIGTYKDRYDGWMLCRFDDTDPDTKRPDLDAYDAILESIEYLGFEPDAVLRASDRLDTYYDQARTLIEAGGAYTCSCSAEDFSALKNDARPCPHRDRDPEVTADHFEDMVAGEYDPGEMVLRVRTDIEDPNPALRDWVAFRMVDRPHPRAVAADYRCWPMLDFQSGIDDHLTGITHIIRGIDLQDSAKRQQFLYDHLGWEYPEVLHWGRIEVDEYDVPLSTSAITEAIDAGRLDGWDDPAAPTLASLGRRGIRGEAVVDAMVELGISTSNVDLAMTSVYAANRDRIDPVANRRFLVRDGLEVPLVGGPAVARPPLHPEDPDRGRRSIPVGDAVRIETQDYPDSGERVWLKGFGCVRRERDRFVHLDADIDVVRDEDVPVIHWVPSDGARAVTLHTMDGAVTGVAEPGLADQAADDILQFERVGFARIDAQSADSTVAYFAHR